MHSSPYDFWTSIGIQSPLQDFSGRKQREQESLQMAYLQARNARNVHQPIDPLDATWQMREVEQAQRNAQRAVEWRTKLRFIR